MSIQSFRCRDTESLYQCERVARWVNIERAALRKLTQLTFQAGSMTCVARQETVWKLSKATEWANTAFESTTSGGSALCGLMTVHTM